MLAANIRSMAEEDLHHLSRLGPLLFARLLAVLGFDELAHHRHFQRPHQIGHEHERILQHSQRLDRLSLVVIGDVTSQFLHPLLDLLSPNYLAQRRGFRRIHETACLRSSTTTRTNQNQTLDRLLLNRPRRLPDQHSSLPSFGAQSGRNRKAAHPYNLVSAHGYRPKPAPRLGYIPLLQQFFDFLRRLRMRRPEPVSRTPVPHRQPPWQYLCSKKFLRIILRNPRLRS